MPKRIEFNTSFSFAEVGSTGPAVPASMFTAVYQAQEARLQTVELAENASQTIDLGLLDYVRYIAVKSDDILFKLELDDEVVGVGQWWSGVDLEARKIKLTNLGVLMDEGTATAADSTTLTDTNQSWIYTTADGRKRNADGFIRHLGDLSFVLVLDDAPALLEFKVAFSREKGDGSKYEIGDLVELIQDAINKSPYLGTEDKDVTSGGNIRASANSNVVTGNGTSFQGAGVKSGDILVIDHEATISSSGMAAITTDGTVTGTGGTTWSTDGVEVGDILLMSPLTPEIGQRASGSTEHAITGIADNDTISVSPVSNSIDASSYMIVRRTDVNKEVQSVTNDTRLTVVVGFAKNLPSETPFKIIRRDPNSVRVSWVDEGNGEGHLRFVSQSPGAKNIEVVPNQGDTRSLALLGLDDLTVNLGGENLDGMNVRIISGGGAGQSQIITGADRTKITVGDWDTTIGDPAAGSGYRIVKPMKGSVELLLAR